MLCKNCGEPIPTYAVVDGKKRNLHTRKYRFLYDLSKINWEEVRYNASLSKIKGCVDLFNKGFSIKEISFIENLSLCTVYSYLYKGNEVALCNFVPYKNNIANCKRVMCNNSGEIFQNERQAAEWCGLKFGSSISKVCNGKISTSGRHPITQEKLSWKFI